jgi:hypothetical protein
MSICIRYLNISYIGNITLDSNNKHVHWCIVVVLDDIYGVSTYVSTIGETFKKMLYVIS